MSNANEHQVTAATSAIRWAVNARSVLLGLLGVCVICGLSPYNNYVINNSFLVGNNLPLGVVVLAFALAVFVNGPLNRYAPRYALSTGEMTVALAMTLVSCCLPGAGLMRYWPSSLVSPLFLGRADPEFVRLVGGLNLPRWLFPSFEGSAPVDWTRDPIVTGFVGRWTEDSPVPYAAWVTPLLTWGVFLAALYGAFFCLLGVVHRQWYENERLPFPLANVYASLIERPGARRWLNPTMGSRAFAIGMAVSLSLHLWNGLALYLPNHVPAIPMAYDLRSTFANAPFEYMDGSVKSATVYLTVIGVTYFLSGQVACGLWLTFLFVNVGLKMSWGLAGQETDYAARYDQHFGAVLAVFGAVLWIGRRHWWTVVAQAVRGRRADEPAGTWMTYPVAAWGLVGCVGIMVGWLIVAGSTPGAAIVTVSMLMVLMTVITRVVAETGLPYSGLQVSLTKPIVMFASAELPQPVPVKSFYLASLVDAQHYDLREVAPVYMTHAARVTDQSCDGEAPGPRSQGGEPRDDVRRQVAADGAAVAVRRVRFGVLLAMALALAVGYVVSAGAVLWTEYTFASTLDHTGATPINGWGVIDQPRGYIVEAVTRYAAPQAARTQRNSTLHVGIGFVVTGAMAALRLYYAWWPLHPVGFVLLAPPAMSRMWFSILLGWMTKLAIVRFGGSRLYARARPMFMGLIIGESLAAGVWLVVALVCGSRGWPYAAYVVSPG